MIGARLTPERPIGMLASLWKTKNYLFVGVTFTSGFHSPKLFKCLASICEGVLLLNPFYWYS
jgi:hypothetical protein